MASATLSRHQLDGALGPIHVDIRSGGRASTRPAVVIVHGFKGFKDWGFFPPFAERLARGGVAAVSFNMSGSGVDAAGDPRWPDRFARNTYGAELHDLGVVIEALMAGELGVAPPTSLGLVGHSRGGGIAILHAARDPRVRALVTWAAIGAIDRWDPGTKRTWREAGHLDVANARTGQVIPVTTDLLEEIERGDSALDIRAAAGRLSIPWLLIHGLEDESVPVSEGQELAALGSAGSTRWLPVEQASHTFGAAHPWKPPVPVAERVFEASVRFLGETLFSRT